MVRRTSGALGVVLLLLALTACSPFPPAGRGGRSIGIAPDAAAAGTAVVFTGTGLQAGGAIEVVVVRSEAPSPLVAPGTTRFAFAVPGAGVLVRALPVGVARDGRATVRIDTTGYVPGRYHALLFEQDALVGELLFNITAPSTPSPGRAG